mgnify:CR=1 FL=1
MKKVKPAGFNKVLCCPFPSCNTPILNTQRYLSANRVEKFKINWKLRSKRKMEEKQRKLADKLSKLEKRKNMTTTASEITIKDEPAAKKPRIDQQTATDKTSSTNDPGSVSGSQDQTEVAAQEDDYAAGNQTITGGVQSRESAVNSETLSSTAALYDCGDILHVQPVPDVNGADNEPCLKEGEFAESASHITKETQLDNTALYNKAISNLDSLRTADSVMHSNNDTSDSDQGSGAAMSLAAEDQQVEPSSPQPMIPFSNLITIRSEESTDELSPEDPLASSSSTTEMETLLHLRDQLLLEHESLEVTETTQDESELSQSVAKGVASIRTELDMAELDQQEALYGEDVLIIDQCYDDETERVEAGASQSALS